MLGRMHKVDLRKLTESGDVSDVILSIIYTDCPSKTVFLIGEPFDGGLTFGIETGGKIYPKNMFRVSRKVAEYAFEPVVTDDDEE